MPVDLSRLFKATIFGRTKSGTMIHLNVYAAIGYWSTDSITNMGRVFVLYKVQLKLR